MRAYQKCIAERRVFEITVPSSSGKDEYQIRGSFEGGNLSCSCKGFRFTGSCKHTRLRIEECGWDSLESVEVQTLTQKAAHECPRCGRRTVEVARGRF